jgi:hypothetical protein
MRWLDEDKSTLTALLLPALFAKRLELTVDSRSKLESLGLFLPRRLHSEPQPTQSAASEQCWRESLRWSAGHQAPPANSNCVGDVISADGIGIFDWTTKREVDLFCRSAADSLELPVREIERWRLR